MDTIKLMIPFTRNVDFISDIKEWWSNAPILLSNLFST